MIKINNTEIIKKSGTFQLDRIWVKKFHIDQVTQPNAKLTLSIEYVTYSELDNGEPIFDLTDVKKVYISDLEQYIMDNITRDATEGSQILNTYNETQKSIVSIINYFMPTLSSSFVQTLGV